MKYLIAALAILCIISCSNDFEIIAPQKDIPIVYGLLTPGDTAQYIRVERAFVDAETSALDLALIPDSLYYNNAQVSLINNDSGIVYDLTRVDGNLEGYERTDGIFATAPNYLYKIGQDELDLMPGEEYSFQLLRGENSAPVTAVTTILEEPFIIRPSMTSRLNFDYIDQFQISWRPNDGAAIYDVILTINYVERRVGVAPVQKSVDWRIGRNIEGESVEREGISFYAFLAGALEADEDITRSFNNIDVSVVSGGNEILEYVKIGQANLGISSSQDIPTYTNLSEGLGLFSSRGVTTRLGVGIAPATIDSLRNGQLTKDLNFQ